jgi:predicted metalloprotease
MRWQIGRRSGNIEDRRGAGGTVVKGGGGVIAMALIVWALGGDPTSVLLQGLGQNMQSSRLTQEEQAQEMDFVSSILGNTEDVWGKIYSGPGAYENPVLVVYSGMTQSACGTGQAVMGPFYCPLDRKLYLDLEFFYDLEHALNAPGDFARAYVIAHEVGHHVQTLMGTSRRVTEQQQRSSQKQANALSVRMELQADCYAGVWGHHARSDFGMLEEGDVEEALNAATQIGDDRLMEKSQGYAVPDSFTHGSSEQRYKAFKAGFDSGDVKACNL